MKESAAAYGALDSLSCFVHGDAIDMGMMSRFGCGKGDVPDIYTKPSAGHWFPGNAGDGNELTTAILFLHLENLATSPDCRVQTAVPNGPFHQSRKAGNGDRIYRRSGSPPCGGRSRAANHPRCAAVAHPRTGFWTRRSWCGRASPRGPRSARLPRSRRAGKSLPGVRVIADGETR